MDFSPLAKLLPYLPQIGSMLALLPQVIARGFTVNAIKADLKDFGVDIRALDWLERVGAIFFPDVRDELQIAAGSMNYAPDYIMKIQKLLNQVASPSPNLDVDGHIGPLTKAAIAAYQKAKGLVVDEFPGDNTKTALEADAAKTLPKQLGGAGEKKNTIEVPQEAVTPLPTGALVS